MTIESNNRELARSNTEVVQYDQFLDLVYTTLTDELRDNTILFDTRIVDVLNVLIKNNSSRILFYLNSPDPRSKSIEIIEFTEMLRSKIRRKLVIALVSPSFKHNSETSFFETMNYSRGNPCKYFNKDSEALEWILAEI